MIRHIVMFSLKPENKEENTAEFLRRGTELCELPVIKSGRAVSRSRARQTPILTWRL